MNVQMKGAASDATSPPRTTYAVWRGASLRSAKLAARFARIPPVAGALVTAAVAPEALGVDGVGLAVVTHSR
ncbi:hypothetical protein GCM10027053_29290 [Intrasporangium mesophilum]